jgi:hypothetical protein
MPGQPREPFTQQVLVGLRGRTSAGKARIDPTPVAGMQSKRGYSFGEAGSTTTMTLPAGLPSSTNSTAAAASVSG